MRLETINECQKYLEGLDGLEAADMGGLLRRAEGEDPAVAVYARSELSDGVAASVVTVEIARAMLRYWQGQMAHGKALTTSNFGWCNAQIAALQCAQARQDQGTPITVQIAARGETETASERAHAKLTLHAVVENAVRAQATEIEISIESCGEGTVVTVTDNGTGVRDLRLLGRRRRTGWTALEHWGINGEGMRQLEQWTLHVETRCAGGTAHRVILPAAQGGEEQIVVSRPLRDGGSIAVQGTRIQWFDEHMDGDVSRAQCWLNAAQRVAQGWEGLRIRVNNNEAERERETLQCQRNVWANNAVQGVVGVAKRPAQEHADVALPGIDAHMGLGSVRTPNGTVYAQAQLTTRYRGLTLKAVGGNNRGDGGWANPQRHREARTGAMEEGTGDEHTDMARVGGQCGQRPGYGPHSLKRTILFCR